MSKASRTSERKGENRLKGVGFAKVYLSGPASAPVWRDSLPF